MNKFWITVPVAAAALAALSCNIARAADEDEAGGEQSMSLRETPVAVRFTLMREADGAEIKSVDKEKSDKGKITYEADVIIDDANYEINVDPSGLLLSKVLDREDHESASDDDGHAKKHAEADDDDDQGSAKEDSGQSKHHAKADDDDQKSVSKESEHAKKHAEAEDDDDNSSAKSDQGQLNKSAANHKSDENEDNDGN